MTQFPSDSNGGTKLVAWCGSVLFFEIALLFLFVCSNAFGQSTVTLVWNPSTSTNVIGYKIYAWTNNVGTTPTNAVQTTAIGNVTNATLNLLVGAQWTFAATAIDTSSNESPFSNFASWTNPVAPTYLITVQASTNLASPWVTITNADGNPIFFRLQIGN